MNRPLEDRSIAQTVCVTLFAVLGLASFGAAVPAQTLQKVTEEDVTGTWVGRYVSTDTGDFELTITRNADGELKGNGWARSDGREEADTWIVDSVQFENDKVTIACTDPSGDVELAIEAIPEGSSIKGTYVVWSRVDGSNLGGGTFTGTKKRAKSGS